MTNKPRSRRQSVSIATIAHRSALPLFLFSFVLLVLLVISHLYLIPWLTTVEIAGSTRDTQELRSYHESLIIELADKEKQRDELILPMQDSAYSRLIELKHEQFPLLVLRSSLEQVVRELSSGDSNVVNIESVRYIPGKKRAELTGDVRNVGTRSMTVLAQLLEELRELPYVSDIASPRFVRKEDAEVGPHSPFTLRMKLL